MSKALESILFPSSRDMNNREKFRQLKIYKQYKLGFEKYLNTLEEPKKSKIHNRYSNVCIEIKLLERELGVV